MRAAPRNIVIGLAVTCAVALVAGAILLFLAPRPPGAGVLAPAAEPPAPRWAPPAAPPVPSATPDAGLASLPAADWLAETSAATGIPQRSLAAYAGAAMRKAEMMPECGLAWNTLAGVGATESDHGRHAGSVVAPNGDVTPPIYGVPLSGGQGIERIPDSDGGTIDGDAEFDRAVGPFQFIPQSWRNWHIDGNSDGVEDPQNIDDAAMAAANYLCRVSVGMDTEEGWRAAIAGFNSPSHYLETVARHAVRYAEAVPTPAPAVG